MNSQHSSLDTQAFRQDWALDATGNWRNFREDGGLRRGQTARPSPGSDLVFGFHEESEEEGTGMLGSYEALGQSRIGRFDVTVRDI